MLILWYITWQHFSPARRAVPVIVAVLSWLYAMGVEEENLAEPTDFYSDGVSEIDVETLFEDLYKMKKASPHEKSKVSPLPNLISLF